MQIIYMDSTRNISVLEIDDTFQAIMAVLGLDKVDYRRIKDNMYIFGTTANIDAFFSNEIKGNYVIVARQELGFSQLTAQQIEEGKKLLGK